MYCWRYNYPTLSYWNNTMYNIIGNSGKIVAANGLEEGEKRSQLLPFATNRTIAIATGCPYSGWQELLPILEKAGVDSTSDAFVKWHDDFFGVSSLTDPMQLAPSLRDDSERRQDVATCAQEENKNSPLLLVDNRSLLLLDYWAATLPKAHFLLFYSSAETSIAHACQQGIELQLLLEGWQAAIRQLLSFHRRHRRRALILNAESAARSPKAMIEVCQRFGIFLKLESEEHRAIAPPPAIERLVAQEILTSLPAIQVLQDEIEASSHPLGNEESNRVGSIDLLNDYQKRMARAYNQQQKLLAATEKLQVTERESHEQKGKKEQLEEQLTDLTQLYEEQISLVSELRDQVEQVQAESKVLKEAKKEAVEENELLLLQFHQVQEELEKTFLTKQQIELLQREQRVQFEKQIAQKNEEVKLREEEEKLKNQIRYSRLENKCGTLETANQELAQENELLLLQLHTVQEELEDTFLRNQNLKQSYKRLDAVHQQNGTLLEELRLAKEMIVAKECEIEKLYHREARLKKTVSWKVTRPLRAMAKPFGASVKEQKKLKKVIKLLKSSGYFDEAYYLSENEDVVKEGTDPVEHYIRHGADEGRDPSPSFNTKQYLEINPDVAETGMNPLVHFVKYGILEGRATSCEA